MTPEDFIRKWGKSELKESAGAQQHFLDLCALLEEPAPADVDPTGERFCFEKGATKSTGGQGFADVWKRGHFGWEYKGPKKDLDRAHRQLLTYSVALENPPLLVVCDTKKIIIRTNWTNTIQETHALELDDLLDAGKRDLLKAVLSDPERLKPKKTRTQLTADAANDFSALAQSLRDRGHEPHQVAHFVNRLVFCMFAEDVGLLPNKLFQKALERSEYKPEKAEGYLRQLFAAMKDGGEFGLDDIPWFNGGLFDSDEALPLTHDDVALTLKAAKLDWQDIDPSILGTLFERGLDPSKRSQLGAHYTDRDKIMMIVGPVLVEPLTAEWEVEKEKIAADTAKADKAKSKAAKTKALNAAERRYQAFIEKLVNFRVLDPACGSGNFLNLSLTALKDLEHTVNLDAEAMGLPRGFPRVGPEAVKGIEINPYAAELARVSIWIGEIQWMRRNGFDAGRNPILRKLGNIECRDALIEQDPETGGWREAEWPDADVIVGNPPFLGNKKMISELGEDYVSTLREIYKGRISSGVDLVLYWFQKAWEKLKADKLQRAGLVATNSIRGGANREVLKPVVEDGQIFDAWEDEEWTVDGAAVRVSLVCFNATPVNAVRLNGLHVAQVYSDLTASQENFDITFAGGLVENKGVSFQGPVKVGSFDVEGKLARAWLQFPSNPNGLTNEHVLRPWTNGMDITRRPSGRWIIDFDELTSIDASLFEAPFEYVVSEIKPIRAKNRDRQRRENWWRLGRSGADLKAATSGYQRVILTPRVSKYRLFIWRPGRVLPDSAVVAISRDDDTTFGILHSKFHELWSLRMGTSLEDRPRYTPTTCFETFPFPERLTPNIPAEDYANDPRAIRIAEAAARLNELRENWLNPPDLVKRVPEVVEGYPDRILPVDDAAEKILKKRTLTNLYNERPAWLDNAHKALDAAVAHSYGWEEDFNAGALTDEEILKRLFELNKAREAAQ
ncbi:class I SAM-dependent DNA methyltransferase [Hyphococcus sp.]|uniref:class I SAM-dependent DNA methyltransferase n=1 Tax=Hyphococcus sp. TaxID=2038636 RepID=UPI003CCBC199